MTEERHLRFGNIPKEILTNEAKTFLEKYSAHLLKREGASNEPSFVWVYDDEAKYFGMRATVSA